MFLHIKNRYDHWVINDRYYVCRHKPCFGEVRDADGRKIPVPSGISQEIVRLFNTIAESK